MQKLLVLFLTIAAILWLVACGTNNPSQKNELSTDILRQAVDAISPINSIYYISNYEELLETGTGIETTVSATEVKMLKNPFVMWKKTIIAPNETWELYDRATEKGFETSIRGTGTEWQTSTSVDVVSAEKSIEFNENFILSKLYLLRENLNSFKVEESQDGYIQYSGTISQTSIVEAYRLYFREFYISSNLIQPDQEVQDNLLEEITRGEIDVLMVGLPSLAFAEKPIVITVWVNEEDNTITKVKVDKTNVIQSLYDRNIRGEKGKVIKVEKATETYKIIAINTFDELPMPQ